MRTVRAKIFCIIPGRPDPRRCAKFHVSAIRRRCQGSRVSAETTVFSSSRASRPTALAFLVRERPLHVGEADRLSAPPVFEQSVPGLAEFDDDRLLALDPTSRDRLRKREQRWHRTHATSPSHASAGLLNELAVAGPTHTPSGSSKDSQFAVISVSHAWTTKVAPWVRNVFLVS